MSKRPHCANDRIYMVLVLLLFCPPLSAQPGIKSDSPAMKHWRSLAPSIQKTLEEIDEHCVGAPPAGIVDAFEMNGDELSVALVDFCGRGAYTSSIVAMRMDHGKPVPAQFRDEKGKIVEREFTHGASAINSVDVKLAAEKKAIYDLYVQNDSNGKPAKCGVAAYVWNAKSETFDLDFRLSRAESAEYCRSLSGQ